MIERRGIRRSLPATQTGRIGGADPGKRHAELFRNFLREALLVNLEAIAYSDSTSYFAREYLGFYLQSQPMAGSAFLSLGTEMKAIEPANFFAQSLMNSM